MAISESQLSLLTPLFELLLSPWWIALQKAKNADKNSLCIWPSFEVNRNQGQIWHPAASSSLYQYTVFWCRCIIYCFWLMVWGYRTSTKCCVHVLEIHISLLAFGKMLKYGINDKAPQFFFLLLLKNTVTYI